MGGKVRCRSISRNIYFALSVEKKGGVNNGVDEGIVIDACVIHLSS